MPAVCSKLLPGTRARPTQVAAKELIDAREAAFAALDGKGQLDEVARAVHGIWKDFGPLWRQFEKWGLPKEEIAKELIDSQFEARRDYHALPASELMSHEDMRSLIRAKTEFVARHEPNECLHAARLYDQQVARALRATVAGACQDVEKMLGRACTFCQAPPGPGEKQKKCPCKTAYYCDADCQNLDWPRHKEHCPCRQWRASATDSSHHGTAPDSH
jgi:hypothetical protein